MEEIIKCKVLDVREFKKKDNYYYHIILKDLRTKERFSLRIEEDGLYFNNIFFEDFTNEDILIKGDIINMKLYDNRYSSWCKNDIEFEILEKESEA